MIKVGLREANMHFSKYIRKARQGQEVIVTDRGAPIAVIKPIVRKQTADEKVRLLEEQGILKRAVRKEAPFRKLIPISGEPLSVTVTRERDAR